MKKQCRVKNDRRYCRIHLKLYWGHFLDRGPEVAQEWMNDIIETHLSDFLNVDHIVDYKTHLQEIVQQYGESLPKYQCIKTTGPEHRKQFHYSVDVTINGQSVLADGHGNNKKLAQQVAAKACVDQLKSVALLTS